MSWIPVNVAVKSEVVAELQLILFETIIGNVPNCQEKVLQVLTNKERIPSSRKSVLDFTFAQKELKKTKSLGNKLKYKHYSPLMVAVEEDNYELAKELLEAGASVAFKNKDRRTALHIACKKGLPKMVQLLLSKAEKQSVVNRELQQNDCVLVVNAKHKPHGWTPLMYAVLGDHVEVVEVLMKCKYLDVKQVNERQQNVFHIAAREGKMKCLEVLCADKSRELEVKRAVASVDQNRRSILHHACMQNDVKLLDWLLQMFETLRSDKYLNLQSARCKKKFKEEAVTIEVESGEYTPFLVACEHQNLKVVKYLMDKIPLDKLMASTCFKYGRGGITALHLAATHGNEELTKFLLEKFASHWKSTTSTAKDGRSHQTSIDGDEALRKAQHEFLLKVKDDKGDTVLHAARSSSSRQVSKYICEVCKDLEHVSNLDGKFPPEEKVYFIPPEIEKMGKNYVEAYMKALDEGKRKIPYYSMLILGEQRVGKTSLYRQLVGKPFMEDLDSTRGIDNNTVETVDIRNIQFDQQEQSGWKEVKFDSSNSFHNAMTEETVRHAPEEKEKEQHLFKPRSETVLMNLIKKLDKQLDPPPPRMPQVKMNPTPHPVMQPRHDLVPKPERLDRPVTTPAQPIKPPAPTEVQAQPRPVPKVEEPKQPVLTDQQNAESKQRDVTPPPNPIVDDHSISLPVSLPAPLEPTPPSGPEEMDEGREDEQRDRSGFMTRKQGISMAKRLKRRNKKKELEEVKDPELTLNTLDFAGQREYRPMHHCFISRRACYLVVFKMPELLEAMSEQKEGCNIHLENIRFWIHSINAHIYPPDEDQKEKDKTISRVILVGTHSKSITQENFKKVEELLDKLRSDRRCVNHMIKLQSVDSDFPYNNFIPVENSCDIKQMDDQYLKESGTLVVQESIKKVSKKLPFLNEDYPIKWLNFKERIEEMESKSPVITLDELTDLAKESRLSNDQLKGQDMAVKFLHDSGKIICLKDLPRLFLRENQMEQLQDKVIIRPRWLISIMRKVIELDHKKEHEGITPASLQDLGEFGIADNHLLEKCWKEELEACGNLRLDHLCFILQAYCLLFPIMSTEKQPEKSEMTGHSKRYLIPCKLPSELGASKCSENHSLFDFKVYFDFDNFLPTDIYHRYVCRLIMLADKDDHENIFTERESIVHHVRGWDWWVEHRASKHALEVSIKGCDHDVKDFQCVHDLMVEVCQGGGMKGLTYQGGCQEECIKCRQEALLICMTFNEGNGKMLLQEGGKGCQCNKCKKTINLYDCYQKVKNKSYLTINDLDEVQKEVYGARADWENLGLALKVPVDSINAIKASKSDIETNFRSMLEKWLKTGEVRNWQALADALGCKTVGRYDLRDEIRQKHVLQ